MRNTSLALVIALTAGLAGPVAASCPDCGKVTGSISVEMATLRADGPKHDRDVIIMLEPVGGPAPAAAGSKSHG